MGFAEKLDALDNDAPMSFADRLDQLDSGGGSTFADKLAALDGDIAQPVQKPANMFKQIAGDISKTGTELAARFNPIQDMGPNQIAASPMYQSFQPPPTFPPNAPVMTDAPPNPSPIAGTHLPPQAGGLMGMPLQTAGWSDAKEAMDFLSEAGLGAMTGMFYWLPIEFTSALNIGVESVKAASEDGFMSLADEDTAKDIVGDSASEKEKAYELSLIHI